MTYATTAIANTMRRRGRAGTVSNAGRRALSAIRPIEELESRVLFTTYYVSATAGVVGNPGTSIDQPMRTIQAAVDAAIAGDTILVRGGTYRETVTTPRSGDAANRITIQNYNNEAVTVNGTDVITGTWTSVGNEVYRAPMSWNHQFENQNSAYNANQVFVNGNEIELARWPNQTSNDVVLRSNAFADSVSIANGQVTFNDADFTDNPNRWVGAKIWVNLARNDTDGQGQTGTVVSATNGSITVSGIDSRGGNGAWSVGAGTEYYLFQPTASALNATGGIQAGLDRGEWFLDTANQQLYVRTPTGAAPVANSVEAKRRNYGFNLDGDSYITIKGINLFGTSLTTDNLAANRNISPGGVAAASNILIDGMTARYVTYFTDQTGNYQMQWQQKSGLILSGTNITFQNGDVRLSSGSGLSMFGRQGKVLNSVFRDLNLQGSEAGMVNFGKTYDPGNGAVISEDHEFAYNTLSRSPQQGINFRALRNSANSPTDIRARIHHNVVHDVMLRSADSGAIETAGVNHQYVRIDHNTIYNVGGQGRRYGIYFDFAGGAIIDHNVIYNVRDPINFNWDSSTNPQNMRIFNNVALSDISTHPGAESGSSTSYGSIIRNNIWSNGLFAGPWPGSYNYPLAGATISNNLAASDALFVDATNANLALRDYRLRSSATTAIDQGVSMAPFDESPLFDGPDADTVAQVDIGAYEFVPSATGTLPAGWTNSDIGGSTPAGSSSYNSSTDVYTVAGGGADIWGTSDQFQFASQSLASDGTLSARVTSQTNTHVWAKAGVMIRASSAANSAFAMVLVTPGNGTRLQYRPAAGAGAVDVAAGNSNAYVRLVRTGANVQAFSSPDGSTWTAFGPAINLGTGSVLAGLAVTSHDAAAVSTATFANVSLTTGSTGTLTNVSTGGTASASAEYTAAGEGAAQAFDSNNNTKWLAFADAATLNYAFASGVTRTVTQYKLTSANDTASYPGRAPRDWTLQGWNGSAWVTVDTQANQAETANFTTRTYSVATPGSYSQYRLNISANNGGGGIIQLAELQLFAVVGTQTAAKLSGTVIGTSGSYNSNGNTIDKAFDGNLSTHFDAPGPNGAWAGLDLGSAKTITQIKFAPRSTNPDRMINGRFQVSNTADFASATTIFTVSSAPAGGTLTTQSVTVSGTWRYVRYLSPDGSYGNIAEMEVHGY